MRQILIYEPHGPLDHSPAAPISRPIPKDVLDIVDADIVEEDIDDEVVDDEFACSGDEDYDYDMILSLILTHGQRSHLGQLLSSSP